MNKKSIYFGGLLLAALTLGSCASDDTATDKPSSKNTLKVGTVFSSEEEPATRTSAKYTGSGLDFYWTASDKIWVKDDNGNYNQSADDDISSRIAAVPGSTTTDKAKFWVNGSYTSSTHKVRYTGKNGTKDKVTIKDTQAQALPNDAAHIAEDGDFGIADATGSPGTYSFTLNHKAAYVTFIPYTAQAVVSGAKIQKIRLYTNNATDMLTGTFDVDDNGTLSNPVGTSNSIELDMTGGSWAGGFAIPGTPTYTTNAATMVVNPGTYNDLIIEYTLYDPVTYIKGTITKTYAGPITFTAGTNTPVKTNLQVKEYAADKYYQWDAQQHYWAGYEWNGSNPTQPTINGQQNSTDAPSSTKGPSAHTPRDYNDILGYNDPTGTAPAVAVSHSAIGTPNGNESAWYIHKGDPHWDAKTLWATMGHLYVGGMWLKKLSVIAQENGKTLQELKEKAPNGTDYVGTLEGVHLNSHAKIFRVFPKDIPSNLNDYFYLPALGRYSYQGTFSDCGTSGYYWTSTPHPSSTDGAFNFTFGPSYMIVNNNNNGRIDGNRLFKTTNENEYRPF